jgi:protein TonB
MNDGSNVMEATPSLAVTQLESRTAEPRLNPWRALDALRLPISFALGLALTCGMFWSLARVISSKVEIERREKVAKIDFSRLRRDSEVKMIKRQKAELLKQVEPPPDAPKIAAPEGSMHAPSAGPIAIGPGSGLVVDVKGMLGGGGGAGALAVAGGGGADRAELPLVRIQPDYPPHALERGIEGWAIVEFTISPTGRTKDVRVVESEPPGTFDQAAVRAIQRWKYTPKIQEGTAVETFGMLVRLDFKISR